MAGLDLDTVRHALRVARENGFAKVEISLGEDEFSATLLAGPPVKSGIAAVESVVPSCDVPAAPASICSTLVGYYQEAPVALRVGTYVSKGDVVAVIEALGLANDVESTVEGEVIEVLVEPDQPVQYGQPLAMVMTK